MGHPNKPRCIENDFRDELKEVLPRFEKNIQKTDSCWNWTGYKVSGYGIFYVKRIPMRAHRISLVVFRDEVLKKNLIVDHICNNTQCVNPEHLRQISGRENVIRGKGPTAINAKRTHCKAGHPLSGENLIPRWRGERTCRTCYDAYQKEYRVRRRAKAAAKKKTALLEGGKG